jgi:hypothetical protein
MEEKKYKIGNKKFRLKKFDDYTHNEEIKIKALLGIQEEGDNAVTINSRDNNDLLPLILVSDEVEDISKFDFNDCKKGMLNDIATDWIAARFFFTKNSANSFSELLLKKIAQTENTKENTESPENSTPS